MAKLRRITTTLLGVVTTFCVSVPLTSATAATTIKSKYVSLKEADCKLIGEPTEEDFSTSLCGKPVDGWSVILDYGDARDSITLRRGKVETPLAFYSTVSGAFSYVGDKFEFRLKNGKAIGTIVRFTYDTNSESPDQKTSTLVVSRLSPKPCVIAVVMPGPTQNATAQKLADSSAGKPCYTVAT
jgi:hypothetical protein